ncbi:MAG: putative ABC transporter permease subunit [Candidatus Aminicenantales bacterium]
MTKFLRLVRVGLRVNFGLSVLRPKYLLQNKRVLWLFPLILIGLAGVAPLLIFYLKGIRFMYGLLAPLGQQAVLLTFALLMGQFLILVFGFYYVLSTFYFSRDLDILVSLPVTPAQVLLSKFTIVVVNEYLTASPIVIPMLIAYGIHARAGLAYWLTAACVYLFLPIIPLAVVSLLVVVMMRFVNVSRKKDALMIGGSLVLMAGALGLQFWLRGIPNAGPGREALIGFFGAGGLVQKIGAKFPPSIWATRALAPDTGGSGFVPFLLFVGVSILLFLALFFAARAFFYRGLLGLGEISARKRRLSREDMAARLSAGRRPVRAIFLRELRIMNRTPIFLLNGVLSVILIPIIFILFAKAGAGQSGSDTFQIIYLLASSNSSAVVLGSALFMTICGCLNGTAASAFSREGAQFWISRVIPISPVDQVKAKFLHSFAIALLGIAVAAVAAVAVIRAKIVLVLIALPIALAAAAALTALGMIIDLLRPLLNWTNPQKAIKQNLNVLIAFFADAGILVVLTVAVVQIFKGGVRAEIVVGLVFLFLLALAASSCAFLLKIAVRRYAEIET